MLIKFFFCNAIQAFVKEKLVYANIALMYRYSKPQINKKIYRRQAEVLPQCFKQQMENFTR